MDATDTRPPGTKRAQFGCERGAIRDAGMHQDNAGWTAVGRKGKQTFDAPPAGT